MIDLGEPTCFACGQTFKGRYDVTTMAAMRGAWKRAPLCRCHLRARSLGGADDPGNVILLCRACHEDAPDVSDPDYMLIWALNRHHHLATMAAEFTAALGLFGVGADELVETIPLRREEIAKAIGHHLSPIKGVTVKPSSWVAAVAMMRKVPLQETGAPVSVDAEPAAEPFWKIVPPPRRRRKKRRTAKENDFAVRHAARLRDMVASGMTHDKIARVLNDEGTPTERGRPWRSYTVCRVLKQAERTAKKDPA